MKINTPIKYLILSILFIAVACGSFFLLYGEIVKQEDQAQKLRESWQIEETKRKNMELLDKSIKNIETEKNILEAYFTKSSDVAPFLDSIEKIATSVGIKGEVISVDEDEDTVELSVGLRATGSFEGIYKFLMLLENSPHELELSLVNIDRRGAVEGNALAPNWDALFRMKLLSFVK